LDALFDTQRTGVKAPEKWQFTCSHMKNTKKIYMVYMKLKYSRIQHIYNKVQLNEGETQRQQTITQQQCKIAYKLSRLNAIIAVKKIHFRSSFLLFFIDLQPNINAHICINSCCSRRYFSRLLQLDQISAVTSVYVV